MNPRHSSVTELPLKKMFFLMYPIFSFQFEVGGIWAIPRKKPNKQVNRNNK